MLIVAKSKLDIKRLKSHLGDEFEMKDLDVAKKIQRIEKRVAKKKFIEKVLDTLVCKILNQ